ncbi:MAG: TetR/AcrR family transcriptional regulator [Actinomycetia bacterium]|nr:TetR/AcrR family transcriptional regulator [Actinomycetes bacterium]
MAAAREVVAEKGFLATTVGDIAERAGRSAGSFYNYFDNREDLLAGLFEEFKIEVMEGVAGLPVDPAGDSRQQLERVVRNYWVTYRRWLPELVGVFQLSMINPEFAARWQEIRVDAVKAIRWWVLRAQGEGRSTGLDPDLAASALGAMLDNFCFVWLARGGDVPDVELDEEAAIQTLAALWHRSLFGDVAE